MGPIIKIDEAEAIRLYDSKFWEGMTPRERATFQLYTDRLCMPFAVFHEAIEKTLGRPVFTQEFCLNHDGLCRELACGSSPPTMDEIINMIPEEKRIVVVVKEAYGPSEERP